MTTRAWVAAEIGIRLPTALAAGGIDAADTTGNLKEPLDDALRMMGATEGELVGPGGVWSSDTYLLPLLTLAKYTTLKTVWERIHRTFDLSSQGDNMRLHQRVQTIERMLKDAEADVVRVFGAVPAGAGMGNDVVYVDMNYLTEDVTAVSHDFPYTVIGVGDG